jgi:uncharacterized repeat protein (TIGR03803 family)
MSTRLRFARESIAAAAFIACASAPCPASAQVPEGSYAQRHAFEPAQGAIPIGPLLELSGGRLVGTAADGGRFEHGTVFELKSGSDAVKVLHAFAGPPEDGAYPTAGVVAGAEGDLWGTTFEGGPDDVGTIFRIGPGGRLEIVHAFSLKGGGSRPGPLTLATDGFLYGTTSWTAISDPRATIYRIEADGTVTTLGSLPEGVGIGSGKLLQASDGRLYGTTFSDGDQNGIVYSLATDGSRPRILHRFTDAEGASPIGLVEAGDGALYGVTGSGGPFGRGTVFRLDRDGGRFEVLHAFEGIDEPRSANGTLVETSPGVFYGTSWEGGRHDKGTVYQVLAGGEVTVVHAFSERMKPGGWVDGGHPYELTPVSDGALVGLTGWGGTQDAGTLYKLRARQEPGAEGPQAPR